MTGGERKTMPDRETVIKESEEAIDILAKADEPTFWMDFVRCAFENALALLKEQEPRVMTSSELQPDDLVWIEVPQSDEIWPALLRKTDWFDYPTWAMRGYAIGGYYLHSGYGRDWRCWTAKPTPEQMRTVKWE